MADQLGLGQEFGPATRSDKARLLQRYIVCAGGLIEWGMIEGDEIDWLFQEQCMLNDRTIMNLIKGGDKEEITGFLIKLEAWANDEDTE